MNDFLPKYSVADVIKLLRYESSNFFEKSIRIMPDEYNTEDAFIPNLKLLYTFSKYTTSAN